MSCTCQQCGKQYRIDLIIPDNVWEKIRPSGKAKDAGLLCGSCIMERLEAFGKYGIIHTDKGGFDIPYEDETEEVYEIIGNVFESPELLEIHER